MSSIVTANYTTAETRKYDTHVLPRLDEIIAWVKQGCTDYSIADSLGISQASLIEYKKSQIKLIEAYTRARTERNTLVMNRMYSKACGEIAKVKQEKLDKTGNKVVLESEIYTPPDVNAADLYLRNNSDEYKTTKSDTGGLTLIQNNYQLPQLEQQLAQIREKRKEIESLLAVDVEVIKE